MAATVNWQRGGVRIEDDGDLNRMINAAKLDYRVESVPLRTDDEARLPIRDRVANIRIDPDGERRVLGFVSKGYQIVRNDAGLQAFDYIVRQAGAKFTRAGTIDHGRIAYAFADLPEPVEIVPGDPVVRSMMFTNSFDGSLPLGFVCSTLRLWCTNQLSHARRKGHGFAIRHNVNALDRAKDAAKLLGRATRAFDRVTEEMRVMAKTPMDTQGLRSYFEAVAPLPDDVARYAPVKAKHERWTGLFENGIGNTGRRTRSLWHAVNAITEDVDHRELSRRVKDPVYYATLGAGGQLKQRAWAEAEKLIGVTVN